MSNEEELKHQHHDTIRITLEDDTEMECKVLTVLECNGKDYLALVPQKPETEGDVYLYGFIEHKENEVELINIEDKNELQAVVDAFNEWCDGQEEGLIPVDIYSGFLGAGKTTLIKKMIKEAYAGEKIVLIENEFGEISIDGGFLKESGVEINEMNSGCICCSLVGDFGESLRKVVADYTPDRIIIEPSGVGKLSDVIKAVEGVADDTPIALNSYVAVVDVNKYFKYMKLFGEFFIDQVKSAGAIVLSRTQNATDEELEKCADALNEINPNSLIITTEWDQIDGKQILNVMESGFDLDFEDEYIEDFDEDDDDEECECGHHHHGHDEECGCGHHHHDHDEECGCDHHHHDHDDECECGHHHHDHDEECGCGHHHHDHDGECGCGHHHADEVFTSWGTETVRKYSENDIKEILIELSDSEKYGTVLRAKGIVQSGDGKWINFDYVPDESDIRSGKPDVTGRLCVIGTGLNEENLAELFKK